MVMVSADGGCTQTAHQVVLMAVMLHACKHTSPVLTCACPRPQGDSFILAFQTVKHAVAFAIELQNQLLVLPWPQELLTDKVGACRVSVAVRKYAVYDVDRSLMSWYPNPPYRFACRSTPTSQRASPSRTTMSRRTWRQRPRRMASRVPARPSSRRLGLRDMPSRVRASGGAAAAGMPRPWM